MLRIVLNSLGRSKLFQELGESIFPETNEANESQRESLVVGTENQRESFAGKEVCRKFYLQWV